MARRRLADGRREELLDGVMQIIAARGFSDVRIVEMAEELHCSVASLYKIAPNKDSLVALAIRRWGGQTLEQAQVSAENGVTASERARLYFRTGAERLHPLSHAFREDMERFESSRLAYRAVSDGFIDRFVELLDDAVDAGEIRPMSTLFLAQVFRQMAVVVRDERTLQTSGLTAEQALLEVDRMIWDGLRTK
jgi:AcrR family transcriptional regulator